MTITGETTRRRVVPDLIGAGVAGVVATGVGALGWEPASTADTEVVLAATEWIRGTGLDVRLLAAISLLGSGWVTVLVLGAAFTALVRNGNRVGAAHVALAGAGATFADAGLKLLVDRARPDIGAPFATALGASFPSGHAVNATISLGVLLAVLLPRLRRDRWPAAGRIVALLVIAIGVSRVGLGVHHPADVVAGWALGVLWLGTTNRLLVSAR